MLKLFLILGHAGFLSSNVGTLKRAPERTREAPVALCPRLVTAEIHRGLLGLGIHASKFRL